MLSHPIYKAGRILGGSGSAPAKVLRRKVLWHKVLWHEAGRMVPLAVLLALLGCEGGGVGDPCIPEEEFFAASPGYSLGEVSVESRSVQCETRVCLVNKFQGRVSCPYGTNGTSSEGAGTVAHGEPCNLPSLRGTVTSAVEPQLLERRPEIAVYCSCRCSGDDPNARYCECPNGFECRNVITTLGRSQQLAGGYCIRIGSDVPDISTVSPAECDLATLNCGPRGG